MKIDIKASEYATIKEFFTHFALHLKDVNIKKKIEAAFTHPNDDGSVESLKIDLKEQTITIIHSLRTKRFDNTHTLKFDPSGVSAEHKAKNLQNLTIESKQLIVVEGEVFQTQHKSANINHGNLTAADQQIMFNTTLGIMRAIEMAARPLLPAFTAKLLLDGKKSDIQQIAQNLVAASTPAPGVS